MYKFMFTFFHDKYFNFNFFLPSKKTKKICGGRILRDVWETYFKAVFYYQNAFKILNWTWMEDQSVNFTFLGDDFIFILLIQDGFVKRTFFNYQKIWLFSGDKLILRFHWRCKSLQYVMKTISFYFRSKIKLLQRCTNT